MLERFSGNRVCLKDGEIEECSKDDGQRRTGLHFTEDGNSSTRTTAYCFLKCSLVWLPLLPSSSSLSAYKQWFVCLPVAFWFQHQGAWATEGNVHASVHVYVNVYTQECMPMNTYTEAWPCLHKLFCFHPFDRVWNHIPPSKYTAAPLNESPLSSASTALGNSSFHALPNGFSNAGTRFLSRLDRHFPLCLEMGIRHWVVCWWWCCWKFLHTE